MIFLSVFYVRLPFDWRTPLGYLFAELFEVVAYASVVLCVTTIFCIYGGCCWVFVTFIQDIADDLKLLSVGGASNRHQKKRQERFRETIRLHSDVKELSRKEHSKYRKRFQNFSTIYL